MAKVLNGMIVSQLSKKTNYDNWCIHMKTLLGSQSLWDIVEKGFRELEEDEEQSVAQIAALEKTRVKDKSALYFLYNAVDESGFEKIANAASSKEAWNILEVAQIRLQTLQEEFECLKMEDKEQVSEYITRVEKLANQLGRNGEPMPASRIVEKILRSLTDDFESIACVIEELNILQNKCLKLDVKDETMMWHFRFGHLNFGGLAELSRKELVLGLRGVEFDKKFCEACVLGKHSRTNFPSSSKYKAKEQLGLIHTDLCGPISPASFSGKKYFISFIDDFSRKTWVYFLQEKSKAFEAFKKFKVMVEKETYKQIKALRSNRGGEFTSSEFMEYCEEQGIKRFFIAPYSPQQHWAVLIRYFVIVLLIRYVVKWLFKGHLLFNKKAQ